MYRESQGTVGQYQKIKVESEKREGRASGKKYTGEVMSKLSPNR